MKKRLISLLLAIVMVLGLIPALAPAANAASNMVAKVEAVGTGYAYDSEEGAFAPTFSSMTAYDPAGNAIDIEGFVWSTPFYTKESFGSANRLFYEPEGGETYYFGIYVDQYVNKDLSYDYTDSKDLMEKSVVTLPGFDVECISSMEREMQSYLELTYAAKKVADAPIDPLTDPPSDNFIDIDGTKLYDGDTYQGSKGGTLTIDGNTVILNNFNHACNTGITISGDILYITIIGNNTIDCRSGNLRKVGGSLCFEGTMHDSLTMKRGGVRALGVVFQGGNYDIPSIYAVSDYYAIVNLSKGASVNVSGDIETAWLLAEDSELSFVNYYCTCTENEHKSLDLTRSRVAYTGGLYCYDLELLWCDVRGGAFKGETYKESNRQYYVSQSDYDFYENMIGTDGAGNSISVKGAYYQEEGDQRHLPYYIDVESANARKITGYDAEVSVDEAVPGTFVTITADPAPEGKVFYRWEIVGIIKDIADLYSPTTTITMDVTNVTAKATYKDAGADDQPTNPFTDVKEGDFYYDPVMWAVENGITTGATATTFNPGGNCLRAHVVTFLHRAEGNPEPSSTKNPFKDVKSSDFFYKPVLWAVEKGITNGTSATTFGSYDNCNRAAVVTFLWRNAGSPEPKSTNNPFVDVKSSDFFYKPVLWAVEQGITNGLDATHFGPATACNRAQVVTFLYRAYN